MAYRNLDNAIEVQDYGVGICFDAKYQGIRRACILDLFGGVMSISLTTLVLNSRDRYEKKGSVYFMDWTMTCGLD